MYRAVIIGAGNIASGFDAPDSLDILTHAHAYQCSPGFQLMGFYDIDYGRAKAAADKWGCKAYGTLEAAVRDAEVVSCCVPDLYHKQALEEISTYCPKLVIAEKPLAASVAEGEKLARIYGGRIPFLLNYSRRFLPEFQSMREEIRRYGNFLKGIGHYGKGILHNGSHMIDLLGFLLGGVGCHRILESEIHDLEGDASRDVILQIAGKPFYMTAIDSRIATIFELDLFFEKARVRILDGGNRIEKYEIRESATYQGYYNYILSECVDVDYSHAMEGLLENAGRVLDGVEGPACGLGDGLNVLKLCMQIRGESF